MASAKPPPAGPSALLAGLPSRRYRKGEPVFLEGTAADAVYLLRSGLVKAVKHSPRSELAAMELIAPGQLFGMIAVMDAKPYPVTAVALAPSEAARIPAALFVALLKDRPDFARTVYASVGDHLRQAQALRALAGETVERRLAHVLLVLAGSMGPTLRLRREDLAEVVGCTGPTAIRALAALRAKGLVASGWKSVTLLDLPGLARLAQPS